jgi:carboxyl-terminal processing protease
MGRFRRGLAVVLVLIPGLAGGWALRSNLPESGPRLFAQVLQLVGSEGIGGLSQDETYRRAARGLVDRIDDEYAEIYSPEELARFSREQLGSSYGGMGMQIEDQQGSVTVTRVFPNTPAERGGVRPGDRVLSVDGQPTRGLRLDEVSNRLIGPAGTTVDVVFARSGTTQPIRGTYTRAIVHIPAVPYAIMLDGDVGYIPLQKFNETAADDVRSAVRQLEARGARSLVLDVRGNGGGSLEESLVISNLFLDAGREIARVEYRNRAPDVYTARGSVKLTDVPLVVLMDGYSASASEIVAGALQDHDRALVLGTGSFGKGLVQQIFSLDGGWALKLTTGQWYTPAGRSIQRDRQGDDGEDGDEEIERPVFRSTGGRIIYGGGGITPDLVVRPDTMDEAEQAFMKLVGAMGQQVYIAVYDQALEVKDEASADFVVRPEWRDALFARLERADVPVSRRQFDEARPLVDRMLEQRIAGLAYGDSAAFRRFSRHDAQVQAALELLRQGGTQTELFAIADRRRAQGRSE